MTRLRTIWDTLGQFGTLWDNLGHFGTLPDTPRIFPNFPQLKYKNLLLNISDPDTGSAAAPIQNT